MRIAIVGGGAAGLMAVASILETANETDAIELFLLEKNNGLGKKVIISGGGRCNVTTGVRDIREVLKRYPRGHAFLSSAMYQFPPEKVYAWFEAHDVPLKIEDDLRVFPQSDQGQDIVHVFETLFDRSDVRVLLNTSVTSLQKTHEGFRLTLKDHAEPLDIDRVILTTGGQAYRHTGSTGDGYAFAQTMGHTITPLAPSLNAFFTQETWPAELAGLSFERATISAERSKFVSYTGPFLFTHKGTTGPAVFALSSFVAFEAYNANTPLLIHIDLFPDQSVAELVSLFEEHRRAHARKDFVNILSFLVPKSLAMIACQACTIPPHKNAVEVSKKDTLGILTWLKEIPLNVIGRGAGDEFVTAGGIDLQEVNPSTMESKLCSGLFFAGEILDIDGFTGGFNLQASWATGRLAGHSCLKASIGESRAACFAGK